MRHGFLLIDKPRGPTSHDIVADVRRRLPERDVGHLGTLDPGASGLLVLAVGAKALKVIEFFKDLPKSYRAVVRLGAVSSTYDADGQVEEVAPKPGWQPPDEMRLVSLLRDRFTGNVLQVPPAHSAVHVGGERAYRRARRGEQVELPAREVEMRCTLASYEFPRVTLSVDCSSGTYIRSLAHDLGSVLGCGAYLEELRRTRVGEWRLEDAVTPENVAWTKVVPLKDVMGAMHRIELTEREVEDVRFGRRIQREVKPDTIGWHEGLPVVVLVPAKDGSRMAQPRKVL